jgi:hypothetical protein
MEPSNRKEQALELYVINTGFLQKQVNSAEKLNLRWKESKLGKLFLF